MTPAAATTRRTPPPRIQRERSLADILQLITLKSPKHAAALKILAEMVLADLTSAEQSPH